MDGELRDDNPLALPVGGKQHCLRVEFEGFKLHEQDLTEDSDRTVKVILTRVQVPSEKRRVQPKKVKAVYNTVDWGEPFKERLKRAGKTKRTTDEAFTTLESPEPKRKSRKKSEDTFDSL